PWHRQAHGDARPARRTFDQGPGARLRRPLRSTAALPQLVIVMEHLHFDLSGGARRLDAAPCIVGVVASGNLDVLIESATLDGGCTVDVDTAARGYGAIWQAVIDDFHAGH